MNGDTMNKKILALVLILACAGLAAASEGASPEIWGLKAFDFIGFNVNPAILLSQTVTFLVALAIVWGFAWKPLVNIVVERRDMIRKGVENAEETRQAVLRLEEEYKLRLDEIKLKSSELLSMAKIEGARAREDIIKLAQKEADDVRAKALEQLGNDRLRLVEDVRAEVVKLAVAVAEKAVGEAIDTRIQQSRFEQILAEIEVQAKKGIAG